MTTLPTVGTGAADPAEPAGLPEPFVPFGPFAPFGVALPFAVLSEPLPQATAASTRSTRQDRMCDGAYHSRLSSARRRASVRCGARLDLRVVDAEREREAHD